MHHNWWSVSTTCVGTQDMLDLLYILRKKIHTWFLWLIKNRKALCIWDTLGTITWWHLWRQWQRSWDNQLFRSRLLKVRHVCFFVCFFIFQMERVESLSHQCCLWTVTVGLFHVETRGYSTKPPLIIRIWSDTSCLTCRDDGLNFIFCILMVMIWILIYKSCGQSKERDSLWFVTRRNPMVVSLQMSRICFLFSLLVEMDTYLQFKGECYRSVVNLKINDNTSIYSNFGQYNAVCLTLHSQTI